MLHLQIHRLAIARLRIVLSPSRDERRDRRARRTHARQRPRGSGVDRLHLRFTAVAFSAVVSLMPAFFLFNAATGLVELVSIGPTAPAALLTSIATSGATHF
jgi:hypothetical protein